MMPPNLFLFAGSSTANPTALPRTNITGFAPSSPSCSISMGKNLVFHHSISMELEKRPFKHSKAVPKGCLAVKVGLDDDGQRRFIIPITYLSDPRFRRLLEEAQEVYGFRSPGPLQIPCSVDYFLHLKWLMEREHTYAC